MTAALGYRYFVMWRCRFDSDIVFDNLGSQNSMDRANRFYRLDRRVIFASTLTGWIGLVCITGCSSWISKNREKENHFVKETRRIQELMADPDRP
ncbi:MAG TPA: hypothetical protein VM260_28190, partial [Pirellula sp.]|nr:hypothetical protein [Pirellula sp.]